MRIPTSRNFQEVGCLSDNGKLVRTTAIAEMSVSIIRAYEKDEQGRERAKGYKATMIFSSARTQKTLALYERAFTSTDELLEATQGGMPDDAESATIDRRRGNDDREPQVHARTLPAWKVTRAKIIWYAKQGEEVPEIAKRLELCEKTTRLWLKRFNELGMKGLEESPAVGDLPSMRLSKLRWSSRPL
jgi:Winged helix-turn helix